MKNFDIVAFICLIIVIYMIIGCTVFILKQLKYNLKFTVIIFISVVIGLGLICLYNYFKNF
jgi:membrane protein YdbS with pleckstrin-like domain